MRTFPALPPPVLIAHLQRIIKLLTSSASVGEVEVTKIRIMNEEAMANIARDPKHSQPLKIEKMRLGASTAMPESIPYTAL